MVAPLIGAALIGGGASLLGGLLGNSAQAKANKANLKLQREQQAWEERMSNTSWQRGVQDMVNAGLNPMLAISQGGASTPNVSAATAQPVDALARNVSSAGDVMSRAIATQQGVANIALTQANARKASAEANLTEATSAAEIPFAEANANQRMELMKTQIDNAVESGELTHRQAEQIRDMLPGLVKGQNISNKLQELGVPSAQASADLYNKIGAAGAAGGVAGKAVSTIRDLIQLLKGK